MFHKDLDFVELVVNELLGPQRFGWNHTLLFHGSCIPHNLAFNRGDLVVEISCSNPTDTFADCATGVQLGAFGVILVTPSLTIPFVRVSITSCLNLKAKETKKQTNFEHHGNWTIKI